MTFVGKADTGVEVTVTVVVVLMTVTPVEVVVALTTEVGVTVVVDANFVEVRSVVKCLVLVMVTSVQEMLTLVKTGRMAPDEEAFTLVGRVSMTFAEEMITLGGLGVVTSLIAMMLVGLMLREENKLERNITIETIVSISHWHLVYSG
jgi:hypothetical protein